LEEGDNLWELKFFISILFVGLVVFLTELLEFKPKPIGSVSVLYEIAQYGKPRIKKYDNGIGLFKPIRIFMSRYVDLSSIFEQRISKFKLAGIYEKVNPVDISLLKITLSLPAWVYFGYRLTVGTVFYGSARIAFKANFIHFLIAFMITGTIYFAERVILALLINERSYRIYDEYFVFVPFFSSCIRAGDNALNAFKHCSILEGEMGKQSLITAQRIESSGSLKEPLEQFADYFNIEEVRSFTQIVRNGEEGKSSSFSEYLNDNLKEFNKRLMNTEMTKHEKRPLVLSVANGLLFSAIMINNITLIIIYAKNTLRMIN
jgi:hypothetical protein